MFTHLPCTSLPFRLSTHIHGHVSCAWWLQQGRATRPALIALLEPVPSPPALDARALGMVHIVEYGNTSAGSIPLALDEAVRSGRIKKGDVVGAANCLRHCGGTVVCVHAVLCEGALCFVNRRWGAVNGQGQLEEGSAGP